MTERKIVIEAISASEGMWLTQSGEVSETERLFVKEVFNPRVDEWKEVDDSCKEMWEYEHPAPEGSEHSEIYVSDDEIDNYIKTIRL